MRTLETFVRRGGLWAVWMIAASGQAQTYTFSTIAGDPADPGYADGANSSALFIEPSGVAVDSLGNLYVADQYNCVVRKVTRAGANWVVSTIAGRPDTYNAKPPIVNGTNSQALFGYGSPTGVAVDAAGNVYAADQWNNAIRKISPLAGTTNWVVSTIAGNGVSGSADGTNAAARFYYPTGVAVDARGDLYVADQYNNTIRKITPVAAAGTTNWVVSTIAGFAGVQGSADGTNANASFYDPSGVAVDTNGNVYVADQYNNIIRRITPSGTNWVVRTIAGAGPDNPGSKDGTNNSAQFYTPTGVAVDTSGNVYVADEENDTIRKIAPVGTNWVVSTLGGQALNSGTNDGVGTNALFFFPFGLAVDSAGDVYVADSGNDTIRLGSVSAGLLPQLIGTTATGRGFQFILRGPVGSYFTIQASTNLTAWTGLATYVIPAGGSVLITDPASSEYAHRFYRPTILVLIPPQLTGMAASRGAAQFVLNGPAGSNCVILVSSDLLSWSPILTNAIPVGGSILINDPAPATNGSRFYRAVLP
ncbi:MAG: NHL repeat-containing protein [Verrucomicrobiota bacterium]